VFSWQFYFIEIKVHIFIMQNCFYHWKISFELHWTNVYSNGIQISNRYGV